MQCVDRKGEGGGDRVVAGEIHLVVRSFFVAHFWPNKWAPLLCVCLTILNFQLTFGISQPNFSQRIIDFSFTCLFHPHYLELCALCTLLNIWPFVPGLDTFAGQPITSSLMKIYFKCWLFPNSTSSSVLCWYVLLSSFSHVLHPLYRSLSSVGYPVQTGTISGRSEGDPAV